MKLDVNIDRCGECGALITFRMKDAKYSGHDNAEALRTHERWHRDLDLKLRGLL